MSDREDFEIVDLGFYKFEYILLFIARLFTQSMQIVFGLQISPVISAELCINMHKLFIQIEQVYFKAICAQVRNRINRVTCVQQMRAFFTKLIVIERINWLSSKFSTIQVEVFKNN